MSEKGETAKEVADLVKRRGSYKGRITIFSGFLKSLDISCLTSTDVCNLEMRMSKLELLYAQYDEIQTRLECIADHFEAQLSERDEFEASYYKILSQAQEILSNFKKPPLPSSSECSNRSRNNKLVKLPTIQLPKFSGSYNNWLEFRDTFTSLIHSNEEIDEVNKFHYLRASLEGSAALVIQSIEFSSSNYKIAWNLLCDRFDNKRLLIQNHVSALFNIEPVTRESSVTLKRIMDQLNKNLRALQSLGEPTQHWDTLLIHIITHKLDSKTFREWEEYKGCRVVKVYIAIFICYTTKAIHLELVGDLTSNSYILALRRFVARRGKPSKIYSDNGTTFVGARNDLAKFLKQNSDSLSSELCNEGINFHFIPAYSPHFGGLWEAGVKSTKFHLQRVLGNCNLTYEELYSTLVQIEAILNSRPLTPLSSHPEDLTPLTPGHFLIGRPLTSMATKDLVDDITHLSRFQRVEQLRQHFWSRWSKEYLSELQKRTKWQRDENSLKLNSLVLIKEDHQPPLKWKLGRIVALYPGSDDIARVADIRTSSGIIRRSFSKICQLPIQEDI